MSKIRPVMHALGAAGAITLTTAAGEAMINGPEDCLGSFDRDGIEACVTNLFPENDNEELMLGSMIVDLAYATWYLTEAAPVTVAQQQRERQKRLDK